jgi:hypothetical protein
MYISKVCSWYDAVDTSTRLRTGHTGVRLPNGTRYFFPSPERPERIRSPPSLLLDGYRDTFPLA